MPSRTTLITDDFNRANSNDVGTTWDVQTGQGRFGIVSNAVSPASIGSDSAETYNGIVWPNDQWAQAAVTTSGGANAGRGGGVGVRMAAAAMTGYQVVINEGGSANLTVYKFVATVFGAITTYTVTYTAGGIILVEVIGTTITTSYQGIVIGSVIDSSIASGRGGIAFSSTTVSTSVDNWSGGGYILDAQTGVRSRRMQVGMGI